MFKPSTWTRLLVAGAASAVASLPASASAQTTVDRLYAGATATTGSSLQHARTGTARLWSYELNTGLPPLRLTSTARLAFSVSARQLFIDFDGAPPDTPWATEDVRLWDLRLGFVFLKSFSPHWSLVVGPRLAMRGDLRSSFDFGKDVAPTGIALVSYDVWGDRTLRIGAGVALTSDTHRYRLFPALGLTLRTPRYIAELGYPTTHLLVRATPDLEAGLFFSVDSGTYRIQRRLVEDARSAEYVRLLNLFLAPTVNLRAVGKVWLTAKLGVALVRSHDWLDADGRHLVDRDADSRPALFGKLGASVRFE